MARALRSGPRGVLAHAAAAADGVDSVFMTQKPVYAPINFRRKISPRLSRMWPVMRRQIRKSARPLRRYARQYVLNPAIFGPFPALQQRASMRVRSAENLQDFRRQERIGETPDAIFLHMPRTAGTAISRILARDYGFDWVEPRSPARSPLWILDHYSINWLVRQGLVESGLLSNARVFTVVRNPFDRAASLFAFLKKHQKIPTEWTPENFLRGVAKARPYPGGSPVARLSMASPQSSWTTATSFWPGPELVFKFENLTPLRAFVEQTWGSRFQLERFNASANRPELNETDQNLVRNIYQQDFHEFGYSMICPDEMAAE